MKIQVLFVDDESAILEGLQNRLRRLRKRWKMRFAIGGKEALKQLAEAPADVLVSDMRMPGMDGATLLHEVRRLYPDCVRLLLTGYSDPDQLLRAMPVADRILTKPCELEDIEAAVEHTYAVQASVSDPAVREIVGRVDALPALPSVYAALEEILMRDGATDDELADVLEKDVFLSARTLQVANAVCDDPVASVQEAVERVGRTTIKALVLSVGLFESVAPQVQAESFSLDQLERRGLLAGRIAGALVDDQIARPTAFTAALMHDIGRLVLAAHAPDRYEAARTMSREEGIAFHEAETRLFDATHGEIGGYLLARWGLPSSVVEAVTYHHSPSKAPSPDSGVVGAVHIATWLAGWIEHEVEGENLDPDVPFPALDQAYLASLGQEARMEEWKELALERSRSVALR